MTSQRRDEIKILVGEDEAVIDVGTTPVHRSSQSDQFLDEREDFILFGTKYPLACKVTGLENRTVIEYRERECENVEISKTVNTRP